MKHLIAAAAVTLTVVWSGLAFAAQKTVTLAVEGMYCPACPYIVQKSIEAVSGVENVVVSREKETAVVTFDDAKTNVDELTEATFDAGYSSKLAELTN